MITSYSPKTLGDVLIIVFNLATPQAFEQKDDIVRIYNEQTNETLGFNIFNASQHIHLPSQHRGQLYLEQTQANDLTDYLQKNGFDDKINANPSRLVIGYVESMSAHPDSDHLNVTKTRVGTDKVVQIVSGSPNMQTGIKVVVAQPGTMMPNGNLIFDGELRGVPSAGMIVSGRELQLKNAPNKPGALILPDDFGQVGDVFDFAKAENAGLFD